MVMMSTKLYYVVLTKYNYGVDVLCGMLVFTVLC